MDAQNETMLLEKNRGTGETFVSSFCSALEIPPEQAKHVKKELDAAADKSKMVISRRKLRDWAFVAHDWNRMHIYAGYARASGYKTTLAHGTLLTAGLEQYVNNIIIAINNLTGRTLQYSGQSIKFSLPVYVSWFRRGKVFFEPGSIRASEGNLVLNVLGKNRRGEEVFAAQNTRLSAERTPLSEEFLSAYAQGVGIVHKTSVEIKKREPKERQGELEDYYTSMGLNPREEVALMHPACFIITSILELSSRRTGRPEGTYRSMNFRFHKNPELGIFNTTLRLPKPARKLENQGYRYKFEALCTQNDKPIISGEVVCYSPNEIILS